MLDGAIAVFDAVAGVEPQSETVWRQADRYRVPRMAFINKMDRVGSDFDRCVAMMKSRLAATPAVIQLPWGKEDSFQGVIDLVEMKGISYKDEALGADYEVTEIPDAYLDQAHKTREQMVEAVAETDDELLEKYLSGEEITNDELKAALRRATVANRLQPVLCGSAFKNKGVQPLLDAVVDYLPSPDDIPAIDGVDPEVSASHRDPGGLRRRALLCPDLQDHDRSICRAALLSAGLLRAHRDRLAGAQRHPGQARSASVVCCRCTPTSVKRSPRSGRAISPPQSASRVLPQVTPSVTPRRLCSSSR